MVTEMKKALKKCLTFAMVAAVLVCCVFSTACGADGIKKVVSVKNVVLMIGDGMGKNHLKVTEDYYGESLFIENLSYAQGEVTTYSANSDVTDSAAAATAMSCGVKTKNGMIAKTTEGELQNMTEYMHSVGKKVGIVATETVLGATPAGFCAHTYDRTDSYKILNSELAVAPELLMGEEAYLDLSKSDITSAGYRYVTQLEGLRGISSASEKVFSALPGFQPYGEDSELPSLGLAAQYAFDFLNADNSDGFFLMVEASHIDKYSHAQDLFGMMKQLKQFDLAVKNIVEKAEADGDTLVIVTADHETGDLRYEKGNPIANDLFFSTSHTGQNVKYFLYGKEGVKLGRTIDNTDICKLIRSCMQGKQG